MLPLAPWQANTADSDICQPENKKTEFDIWYIRILIINFIKFSFISHVWHSESSMCEKNIIFIYIIYNSRNQKIFRHQMMWFVNRGKQGFRCMIIMYL